MSAHAAPAASQRCQAYVYVGVMLNVPVEVVSVWPCTGVPVIVGGSVDTGVNCCPDVRDDHLAELSDRHGPGRSETDDHEE